MLWSQPTEQSGELHGWTPYGEGNSSSLPVGFNGQRADSVSGMYHLGNGYRTYNPVLMRFNSPDSFSPFGAGGINPYAYCLNDPINRLDPTGHISGQAIVSGALEDASPEASSALGWVSMATGIAGLTADLAKNASKFTKNVGNAIQETRGRLYQIQQGGLSGRGAPAAAKA
ncbi:RHS repeat-associated core domain-containing protein [Xenorhabdus bovienii]|uniref:RHS repeat-associated core domain-containing protein n=1 Tax=Xenorhabdus bovienii TaxID=40576 RepID=UPI0030B8B0AB